MPFGRQNGFYPFNVNIRIFTAAAVSQVDAELALDYTEAADRMKVTDFLELCKNTIGATFHGYKGGQFTMSENTPIWVANYGNSGSTALIEVVDNNYQVILITGYREY